MRYKFFLTLTVFLLSVSTALCQAYYKVGCQNVTGDGGKEYALDTVNFKAYLVTENSGNWNIFKVDLLTGVSSSLSIVANNEINCIYYRNDSLYFGGKFTTVNTNAVSYKYFAVYNTVTNALQPGMNAKLNGEVTAISIHKNKLFLTGAFTSVLTVSKSFIVSIDYSNSPLIASSISSVTYPSDLTFYLSATSKISKMKSYGDYLFFILDNATLYNFVPYPTGSTLPSYIFTVDMGANSDSRIYDYEFCGQQVYVCGNFMITSTGTDLFNYTNTTSMMSDYEKVSFYNLFNGTLPSYYNNLYTLFQPTPNTYSSEMSNNIPFGCSGIHFRNNKFDLVFDRSDYPVAGRNTIINCDTSFTGTNAISYTSIISGNSGTQAGTDYYSLNNSKLFSNILVMMASNIGYHAGTYYPNSDNDSLLLVRSGNSTIQGFSQAYGSFCKGDTIILKLKKQGNLHGHQWSYSGTGCTILTANSDSAKVVFSYGASASNLKIVALDNFNLPSDTFSYPVTFKPIPNVSAGPDKSITCRNTSVKLTTSTSLTNYNVDWITPAGFTTFDSLTGVTQTGIYYARIKDNITGCYGYDTIVVVRDTVKPGISFPALNNYSLTCKQNTRVIIANAINAIDTMYWNGNLKYVSTASITATVPGKLYINCIGSVNGCKRIDSVTIFQNVVLPPIFNNVPKDSITCTRDSVFLDGSSSAGKLVFWRRPGFPLNDSVADPIYTKLIGFHTLVVRDTVTGCKSSLLINVSNSALNPYIAVNSHTAEITCSQSFVSLTGSSATPGALLSWTGPASFTSANPASVSVIGVYTVTATDPSNGCTKSDTVKVTKQNSLLLSSSNDTTICNGSSIVISSTPLGGTAPYTYNWQGAGSNSQLSISPTDTTKYSIIITDNTGCIGKDSVIVNVPNPISDSVVTFQPCDPNNPNGQIQIFANGGTAPYMYSLNSGIYQSSNIFTNLNYGSYSLSIKDLIGCTKNSNANVSNGSLAPSSDFIVSTNLFQTDTFIVVDITNPKPDTVIWVFPSTFTVINNSNPYAPVVICSDTGYYTIQQTAYFGGCQTNFSKTVHITYNDGSFATAYNNNGIQNVTLSPNPNDGQFNLNVSMYKKQTFAVFVTDASGVEKLRFTINDSDTYSGNIIVPNVTNGTHVLKVISAYDSKYILFVVTQ